MWFKVGDELTFHPRVLRAGNAAMGLWVRAGAYCSEHLTDGWISHDDARSLGSAAEIKRLVAVGLWIDAPHGDEKGYQFHRWSVNGVGDKRQPTRAEVEEERERARQRQERYRQRKLGLTSDDVPPTSSDEEVVTPLVTRYVTRDNTVGDASVTPLVTDNQRVSNGAPSRPVPSRPNSKELGKELLLTPSASVPETRSRFDEFWNVYPRRVGKRVAESAFEKAVRRSSADEVIAGATRFASDPNLPEPQFQPHPATWLNRDGWNDDPLPGPAARVGRDQKTRDILALGQRLDRQQNAITE